MTLYLARASQMNYHWYIMLGKSEIPLQQLGIKHDSTTRSASD